MIKPESNFQLRRILPIALIALVASVAIPTIASAQDPAGDQYAPGTPTGGGYDPTPTPDPDPSSGSGSQPIETSGNDNGSPGGTGTSPDSGVTPSTPTDESTDTGTTLPPDSNGNKDERTIDRIAANAETGRDQRADGTAPDAQLVSSDAGTGTGIGALLWVLIGAALLWAVAMGVMNFRRRNRDDDGRSETNRSDPRNARDENEQTA